MGPVPTIKVVSEKSDSGYVIINESDFDEGVHVRYVEVDSSPGQPAGRMLGAGKVSDATDDDGGLPRPLNKKMPKAKLVAEAVRLGLDVVPDEMTNQQIVDAINELEGAAGGDE